MTTQPILAWHFVGATLRDGRPIPADGERLEQGGEIIPCQNGFHASERIIDALKNAPGDTICRVECSGVVRFHGDPIDKLASSVRVIQWRVNGEALLRQFARECALEVAHLWDMPAIVREYLEAGDNSKRYAARAAATGAAARYAARAAVTGTAARYASWAAAEAAARYNSWAAASAAAQYAAWAATWAATWAAARAATWAAQNARLTALVEAEHARISA